MNNHSRRTFLKQAALGTALFWHIRPRRCWAQTTA